MRTQIALLRHEWRLQTGSLRFRFGLALFFAFAAAPAVMTAYLARRQATLSTTELLAETLSVLPFAALVLAVIVAGNTARLPGERELLLSGRISGFGFLTRKSVALASLVLPATLVILALPLVIPLVLRSQLPDVEVLRTASWRWILEVAPRALVGIVGWLALVRIFRSEVAAFLVAVLGTEFLLAMVNRALFYLHVRMTPGDWTGFATANYWVVMIPYRLDNHNAVGTGSLPGTEAPYPVDLALQSLVPGWPIVVAFVLASFALAASQLGRSVGDAPPLRLGPDHPMRSLALTLDGLRARFRPDAGRTPGERITALVCLLTALLLLAMPVARSLGLQRLLEERYETEWRVPETGEWGVATSRALEPRRLFIRGTLTRDGRFEAVSRLELYNGGTTSIDRLGLELNRGLAVKRLEIVGERDELEPEAIRRGWHRLEIALATPIAPNTGIELVLETSGTPADYRIPLQGWNNAPFPDRWQGMLAARFPREISTLSDARMIPRISPRAIRLDATSLSATPRYTTWQPVIYDDSGEEAGRRILPEQHRPPVEVELDLELPGDWFLADPCGNVSSPAPIGRNSSPATARLEGRCRVPLSDLALIGGALGITSSSEGEAIIASRSKRREHVLEIRQTMSRVVQLSGRAWPGLEPVERVVAVEVATPFETQRRLFGELPRVEVHGQLLAIPELQLTWALQPIDDRMLITSIVRPRLPEATVPEEQKTLADQLLTAVLTRRMGLSDQTAAISGRVWRRGPLSRPLLEAVPANREAWNARLPAVLYALEARVGAAALVGTLDDFLRRSEPAAEEEKAGLRVWFDAMEERTGADLDDLWDHYFVGDGLPDLRVEEIEVRRLRNAFAVSGTLVNLSTGESRCPIVVKSEREQVETTVIVGPQSATPFSLSTRLRPHTLQLDPGEICLRFQSQAAKESFRLLEGT